MRTDAKISTRRNVQTLNVPIGHGQHKAGSGDWVCWHDGNKQHCGRVIGIVDAPALGETPAVSGFLCVAMFNPEFLSIGERWVDPASVYAVRTLDPNTVRHARFGAWLFGAMDPKDDWRRLANEGSPPMRIYQTGQPFGVTL